MALIAEGSDLRGLSTVEVDVCVRAGQVNHLPDQTSRTHGGIVRGNVFTRFNAIISVLAAIVLAVGARSTHCSRASWCSTR